MSEDRNEDWADRPFMVKFSRIISILIIGAMIVYTAMSWSDIPQTIVTHFNASGTPDGSGSKWTLLLFPAILIIMFIAMTAMTRFPKAYNYPVKLTEQNKAVQYELAKSFVQVLILEVTVLMGYIQWAIVRGAIEDKLMFDSRVIIALAVILIGSVAIYFYRAVKNK